MVYNKSVERCRRGLQPEAKLLLQSFQKRGSRNVRLNGLVGRW